MALLLDAVVIAVAIIVFGIGIALIVDPIIDSSGVREDIDINQYNSNATELLDFRNQALCWISFDVLGDDCT